MPTFPSASFPSQVNFPEGANAIQELLNVQKLSLPANTAVGAQVAVTDGFVLSGSDVPEEYRGFYTYRGSDAYTKVGHDGVDNTYTVFKNFFGGWDFDDADTNAIATTGALPAANPWEATGWLQVDTVTPSNIVLAHPALQQLTAPQAATTGILIVGAGKPAAIGIYLPDGTFNGRPAFKRGIHTIRWKDVQSDGWEINHKGSVVIGDFLYTSTEDVEFPWQVSIWVDTVGTPGALPVLYVEPTDIALFVAAGAQSGVYIFRPIDSASNIDLFDRLGDASFGFQAETATIFGDWGVGPDSPGWVIYNGDGAAFYTTDLVLPGTNWKNASDDSSASITVTSVTTGQLVAGNKLASVVRAVSGATNGRNKFSDVLGVAPDLTWDGTKWTDGTTNGSGNTAFPDIGSEDPVASEANWQ